MILNFMILDKYTPLAYNPNMKETLFDDLVASVREGGAILRGEKQPARAYAMDKSDIQAIRERYQLSQAEFARLLGISLDTLQNWEQGRRVPRGPARVLLQVAEKHPGVVWDVVKPITENK
jgi:putative transcriptional regulator